MTVPLKICFVCEDPIESINTTYHTEVNLPVCDACRGTDQEKCKVNELLEGMAEGFVCGCI